MNKKIIGLMACDPNGLIGAGNALPWHYPEDLEHFRTQIHQQIIIMGRKTFLGLPQNIIDNHCCIVLSQQNHHPCHNVIFVDSISALLNLTYLPTDKNYYMIGGAETAHAFFNEGLIAEFILTQIKKQHAGDVFLPLQSFVHWPKTVMKENADFCIYHYVKP
jgi:dihydrofolate reductase